MSKFEVTALGGEVEYEIEADHREHAEEKAQNRLMEEFRHTVGVKELKVYKAVFKHDGTNAGVVASSEVEAREAAKTYIMNKQERALDGLGDNMDARDLLKDMSTQVRIAGTEDRRTYEINEEGRWEEGEI